ncbi:MAG: hypothetical protein ACX933_04130 [Marinobacter adhaerens]
MAGQIKSQGRLVSFQRVDVANGQVRSQTDVPQLWCQCENNGGKLLKLGFSDVWLNRDIGGQPPNRLHVLQDGALQLEAHIVEPGLPLLTDIAPIILGSCVIKYKGYCEQKHKNCGSGQPDKVKEGPVSSFFHRLCLYLLQVQLQPES